MDWLFKQVNTYPICMYLDLKTKMPKCMANAFFYRPKFKIIDLMTNCLAGGNLLTW